MSGGLAQKPTDEAGVRIVRVLQQNSDLPIDVTCIPKRTRVEFGIPATAKAMEAARTSWQTLEGAALSEAIELDGTWQSTEVAAA